MSNCFYAVKGIIGSVETLIYDFKNLGRNSGEYNWFNIIFYDPLHILGDFTVCYEMCNVYEFLDKMTGLMSLDWGLLGEQVTNISVYLGLEAKELLEDIAYNMGEDCLEDAVALTNEVLNDIIDEGEEYLAEGDTVFDVDGNAIGTMIGD